jgi:ribosomal protein L16 Arg81 hydroxylase
MSEAAEWSLRRLLGPVSWDDFLSHHWQKAPLHVARGQADFFSGLADKQAVDHLIATQCGRPEFPISVVGAHLESESAPEPGPVARTGWTPERVYRRLAQGATIRIGNTPHYIPAVRSLAACFETELSSDIAVNLYLTPPEARAFGAHYDNHDVFILQVEGEKSWTLRAPPDALPLETIFQGRDSWLRRALPWETSLKTLPPVRETRLFRLEAGDMLYVPRGHVHEVVTGKSASLHLTVAAPVVTWYEVAVPALLAAARRSARLRSALPPGFATDPAIRSEAAEAAPEMLAELVAHLRPGDLADSLARLADLFVHSRDGDWQGAAADAMRAATVGADSELVIRPGLACTVHEAGPELLLLYAGRVARLPIRVATMVDHILAARRFRVRDLPSRLDEESRIVLARALVEKGLLTFAESG